jgi:hypothetical protein
MDSQKVGIQTFDQVRQERDQLRLEFARLSRENIVLEGIKEKLTYLFGEEKRRRKESESREKR